MSRGLTNQSALFKSDSRAWKEPFSEVYMMTFSLYSKLV